MIRAIFLLGFILIVLGLWVMVISRYPRPWRKVYQDLFEGHLKPSVNRNKRIDERVMKDGMIWGIGLLFGGVLFFMLGIGMRPLVPSDAPVEEVEDPAIQALREQFDAMEDAQSEREKKDQIESSVPPAPVQ